MSSRGHPIRQPQQDPLNAGHNFNRELRHGVSTSGQPVQQPQHDPLNAEYHFIGNHRNFHVSTSGQPVQQPQQDPLNAEAINRDVDRSIRRMSERIPPEL